MSALRVPAMPMRAAVAAYIRCLVAGVAIVLPAPSALAACGGSEILRCHGDTNTIGAVVWAANGFTAAAQSKSEGGSGLILLNFAATGQVRNVTPVPWPNGRQVEDEWRAVPRRLVALPDGSVVVLANVMTSSGEDIKQQHAWAIRIGPNGQIIWSRIFSHDTDSTIFYSGQYDQRTERLLIVGRRTNGFDPDHECKKWSQSLVVTLSAATGQPTAPALLAGPSTIGPTSRQAIYDIAPGDRPGSYVVTGFATAPRKPPAAGCQDNIFVGVLTEGAGRWTLGVVGLIGDDTGHEVGFTLKSVGGGIYVIAGAGRDFSSGAPAAQAYRVTLKSFLQNLVSLGKHAHSGRWN